jgi:hypothetical protein
VNQILKPTSSPTFSDLPSQSDEALAKRLVVSHGVGAPIFDEETDPDELNEILEDLGVTNVNYEPDGS